MSELRQDPTTREWVIIATERRRRPHEFGSDFSSKKDNEANLQEYSKDCPFCPGNEYLSPHETASYRTLGTNPNSKGWWVRVIPNKFAALSLNFEENAQVYEGVRAVNPDFSGYFFPRATEVFRTKPGIGAHEVVIDNPKHNEQLPFFSDKQIQELFLMYRERYLDLRVNPKFKYAFSGALFSVPSGSFPDGGAERRSDRVPGSRPFSGGMIDGHPDVRR